jgi:hypothetical protein
VRVFVTFSVLAPLNFLDVLLVSQTTLFCRQIIACFVLLQHIRVPTNKDVLCDGDVADQDHEPSVRPKEAYLLLPTICLLPVICILLAHNAASDQRYTNHQQLHQVKCCVGTW